MPTEHLVRRSPSQLPTSSDSVEFSSAGGVLAAPSAEGSSPAAVSNAVTIVRRRRVDEDTKFIRASVRMSFLLKHRSRLYFRRSCAASVSLRCPLHSLSICLLGQDRFSSAASRPGASSHEPRVGPAPQELVFDKTTNSAFKVAGFASFVASKAPAELVIAGLATDACVTATAREAKDLGYNVATMSDACATFARMGSHGRLIPCEVVHDVALAALRASGVAIRNRSIQSKHSYETIDGTDGRIRLPGAVIDGCPLSSALSLVQAVHTKWQDDVDFLHANSSFL